MFAKKHSLAVSLDISNYTTFNLRKIKPMLCLCCFPHREPESVSEQPAGLSRSAAGRDQPGGDGGPLCPQTAGDPQGHR